MSDLLSRALELGPRLVDFRRHLHQHPELSGRETATQAFLERELAAAGFESTRVAETGVLARVASAGQATGAGGGSSGAVALRADMDALPIQEETGLPFASVNAGVMHACGHDAHMTMVFGAGLLLRELLPEMAGRFVLLFQPAEEGPPGGAKRVIAEGVLDRANVRAIFGMHVDPRYPAGTVLLRKGPLMAASDRFRVTVIGRGGHAGYPHLTVDPIVIAAQIVLALQTIVARQVEPIEPAVISVGRIAGGTADNIIPDQVVISGTIRTHNAEVRRLIPERIEQTARGIAGASGARAEFEYIAGNPGLSNDPKIIDLVEQILVPVLGADRIMPLPKPIMGGEDFAHYLEKLPGAFLRIGVRNEAKGATHPIHNSRFALDEDALPIGAAALAAVAARWCAGPT